MKILDRYILSSFLKNWAISFMVLVGMYMVLDMVFNFEDIVAIKPGEAGGATGSVISILWNVAHYYFFQSFLFFNRLSGIIPVVAAAFTLMRLSRFNELTAVLAAGVPLLRVAMPIILAGVVLNALVILNQELIIPNIADTLSRDRDQIQSDTDDSHSIRAMQDEKNSLLFAGRYRPPTTTAPAEILYLDVLEHNDKDQVTGMITAERAEYDPGEQLWTLTNGHRVTGLRADETPAGPTPVNQWKTNINPEEVKLFRKSDYVELLSTDRINQLIERPRSYGRENLLRVKHQRFTQPLMNVVLLLLAIPCVLTREIGKLKAAATKTLILTGIGMGSTFLAQQIAITPPERFVAIWPMFMAWVPIFVFAPLAVFLLDRVKT